jgi:hypothetical protein
MLTLRKLALVELLHNKRQQWLQQHPLRTKRYSQSWHVDV